MEASNERSYQKLVLCLEELTKLYRSLLDVVRKEKDILIAADVEKLNDSNKVKETLLYKIRSQDSARERYAKEFADLIGADSKNPRLLEMAKIIQGEEANRLRVIHAALEMLVKRASDINKENEQYAQSALHSLNGAMNDIKDTLAGKKTYAREGTMAAYGPARAGNFVSKEV
ncbi:MAG: flagellar protein FlgN [Bdellovibrio sp. CG10_big_fil_rev_8_21_14_0_10_47_8]|nr:MAG: flagellar protein FlgN [Bdellovibrio sp. CG10_big_fil_rev_8_21_14_0_10_47_8]